MFDKQCLIDTRLVSVFHDSESNKISIRLVKGETIYTIALAGVEKFLMTDFREKNFVDEVRVLVDDDFGQQDMGKLSKLYFDMTQEESAIYPEFASILNDAKYRISLNKLSFFEIVPSFGAAVLSTCSSLSFLSEAPNGGT